MRVSPEPTSLVDVLVFLAFAPLICGGYFWDYFQRSRAQRKAIKAKPKRKPRAAKPKALTAAQHRKLRGVSPALRVINGGKA